MDGVEAVDVAVLGISATGGLTVDADGSTSFELSILGATVLGARKVGFDNSDKGNVVLFASTESPVPLLSVLLPSLSLALAALAALLVSSFNAPDTSKLIGVISAEGFSVDSKAGSSGVL